MKTLILNGSPRKDGNTRYALQKLYQHLDPDQTEFLDVCSFKLSGCIACDGCKHNGGTCVMPDDSAAIIEKIVQADCIIFGTPVYWWGMSSQLKMVVDKFYSQDGPFKTMKKKIGLVVVGANPTTDPQYELIDRQFSCIAQYLHWDMAFQLNFSAYAPGDLSLQEESVCQLEEAARKLLA